MAAHSKAMAKSSDDALPPHLQSRQKISSTEMMKGFLRRMSWKAHPQEQRPGRSLTQPSEDECNDLEVEGMQNGGKRTAWECSPEEQSPAATENSSAPISPFSDFDSLNELCDSPVSDSCSRPYRVPHTPLVLSASSRPSPEMPPPFTPFVRSRMNPANLLMPILRKFGTNTPLPSASLPLVTPRPRRNSCTFYTADAGHVEDEARKRRGNGEETARNGTSDSCSRPYCVPHTPLVLSASSRPSPEMPPPFTPFVRSRMNPATLMMPILRKFGTNTPLPSASLPLVTPRPRRNSCTFYTADAGHVEDEARNGEETVGRVGGKIERFQRCTTLDSGMLGGLQEAEDSATVAKLLHALQTVEAGDGDGDGGETRRAAAKELRGFAKKRPQGRGMIVEAGGTEILVECLRGGDLSIEEDCVTALFHTLESEECRRRLCEVGGIDTLVEVLESSIQTSQENAAAAIFVLSESPETRMLVRIAGGVKSLVALLIGPSLRGRKDAALALFKLSLDADCAKEVVRVGGVAILLRLVTDPVLEEKAAAVILNLSRVAEGRKELLGEVQTAPALAAVIEGGSQRAKEDATGVLLLLAKTSSTFVQVAVEEGMIPTLHALSQTGTRKARLRASALLRILRGKEWMEVTTPSKYVLRVVGGSPKGENKPQEWWQLALARAQVQVHEQ